MPTHEERERFTRDFEKLSPEMKRAFANALAQFTEGRRLGEVPPEEFCGSRVEGNDLHSTTVGNRTLTLLTDHF